MGEESEYRLLQDALEQVELADRLGFDVVWEVEHHFLEEYSHSSAPEVFLGACSQRTKDIRLGHGIVQTAPGYNHPARTAERVATLDLLSGGRVEFGSGESGSEAELGGFLVDPDTKREAWLEGLEVALRCMTETPFTGVDGRFVQMPPRNVVPKPMQRPHPPLWVACSRRDTILLAAEKGIGALTFAFIDPEEATRWVADYEATLAERCVPVGLAVNPTIACVTQMMCHPDERVALDRGLEGGNFFGYSLGHYYVFGEHRPGSTDVWREYLDRRGTQGYSPEIETALRQERLGAKLAAGDRTGLRGATGTPAQVREYLERFEQAGVDQVIFVLQAGNNAPRAHLRVARALRARGAARLQGARRGAGPGEGGPPGAGRRRRPGAADAPAGAPAAAPGLLVPRHPAPLGGRDGERGDARLARELRRRPGTGHQGRGARDPRRLRAVTGPGRRVRSPATEAPRPQAGVWRVLVTGATGRVGFPVARALAARHQVLGLARCRGAGDRRRLVDAGIEPIVGDLAALDLATLPEGITHVFHAAARFGRQGPADWQQVFETNAQASGRLVAATAGAAFVYCSSGSAYAYQGRRPLAEDDPPGVHLGDYSLSKIAGEAVVRYAAATAGSPLTIIRIFSTYGPEGGAPVTRLRRILAGEEVVLHPDAPNNYNPVYEDDYVRLAVRALEVAAPDPVVVNFAGSETVSAEDYCAYLGELVQRPVRIRYDDDAPWPLWPDVTRMHAVLGRTRVPWREGMRRLTERLG